MALHLPIGHKLYNCLFSRNLRSTEEPMKKLNLFIIAILLIGTAFAQESNNEEHVHGNWCGKHHATQQYFIDHPEARQQAIQDSIILAERARTFNQAKDGDYIIPVVFHIVHANGPENISDEQVHNAIDEMNRDFSATNVDFGQTISAFEGIAANVGIEFQLARKDPDGNCTNGINRVYNPQTSDGGENVKTGDAATWGRSSYLNIWVVDQIEGNTAAYAYLPGGGPVSGDGIICQDSYVGSIGTSSISNRHTLSHEVGHWINLEHPWGWSNSPGLSSNCNMDDGVSDTPETIGWTSCNLQGSTCGSLDNVQNFMDYSYCSTMFTEGQKTEMLSALTSSVANRNQLWTDDNLEDTGLLDEAVVCEADFVTEDDPIVCPGGIVAFEDRSYNAVTNWEWTFEGGSPATSDDQNPEVTYNEPGVYDVTLTASNANGELTTTKTSYVTVIPFGENNLPYYEDFESFSSLEPNDANWFVQNEDGTVVKWQLTDDASVSGSKSVFVNGRSNPFSYESLEYLLSPTYDLSGISENAVFTFKYAHAKRTGSSDDQLRVFISKNCGDNWSLRESLDIDELPTVEGNVSSAFVPESDDDWATVEIDNISSVFLNESFRVRFEYRSYRGNNLYIDDINIFNPATVGVENLTFVDRFDVYPNPTQGTTNLAYTLIKPGTVAIDILDLSGRVVQTTFSGVQNAGEQLLQLELTHLQTGVYIVRMQSNGEQIVRKLVVQ